MSAFLPSLAQLRRSVLGAWLAVAYALAVLAAGLAPGAAIAHPGLDGALLCSGLATPNPDLPQSGGEPAHCKGCPVNPALAAPDVPPQAGIVRIAAALAAALPDPEGISACAACALPPSRAPPAA